MGKVIDLDQMGTKEESAHFTSNPVGGTSEDDDEYDNETASFIHDLLWFLLSRVILNFPCLAIRIVYVNVNPKVIVNVFSFNSCLIFFFPFKHAKY